MNMSTTGNLIIAIMQRDDKVTFSNFCILCTCNICHVKRLFYFVWQRKAGLVYR